jgi:hypothetical protein
MTPNPTNTPKPNVGASLLAKAPDQSTSNRLTQRIREQPRSHKFDSIQ